MTFRQTQSATTAVIVVAAGSGGRLGKPDPKALVMLSGRSILARSLDGVFGMGAPVQVIVVAPPARLDETRQQAELAAGSAAGQLVVVAGGHTRQASVAAGLAALAPGVTVVLVHDAARAFAPPLLFDAVAAQVQQSDAAVVPGLAVIDTVKEKDSGGRVVRTVDRSALVTVQTPQGFPRDRLVAAYAQARQEFTDDAALFAAAGHPVTVVEGDPLAFKITTPWDLRRAEALAAGPQLAPADIRTGIGVDAHAYDDSAPLWLGAMHWPGLPGLAGHSDGDVISHAICDALLSAAGLGDLGSRFGTADPAYLG
ncbi:MAG: 2-C-methyl-D-erythritol 4-phosphate cytidylyltransferase, partial [Microbacteriaceae bacterium]